jgi:lipid II:glycine glycyltransferase (peptidoglycan interpeptide bridge formation enzyme)
MNFDIDVIAEVPFDKWQVLLDNSINVTPFHLQNWIDASALTYGYKPLYLIARDANGTILAGMPILESRSFRGILRAYHSQVGGSYGSVIIREDADPDILKKILARFDKFRKKWNVNKSIVVDFHNTSSYLSTIGFNYRDAFTHILNLNQTLEDIHNKYDYSIRKNIEKAKRNGIVVHTIESIEGVEEYYKITHAVAQKYNREPYPRELFLNIFRLMVPRGEAKFSLTFRGEQPLSGALHLISKGHIFNWLMPAYPEFLEYRPNEALVSSMIDWASENGFSIYNFGGSPTEALGLIQFKEKWGTKKWLYNIYEFESSSLIIKIINKLQYLRYNSYI